MNVEGVGQCHCKATRSSLKGHGGWGRFLRTGRKKMSLPISRTTRRQIWGATGLLLIPEKVMEQIIQETVSEHEGQKGDQE